jgi:hypothetical protein
MRLPCINRQSFGSIVNKQSSDECFQKPMIISIKPPEETEIKWLLTNPGSETRRIAGLMEEREVGEMIDASTDHAMLVVLGYFAQALALVEDRWGNARGPTVGRR